MFLSGEDHRLAARFSRLLTEWVGARDGHGTFAYFVTLTTDVRNADELPQFLLEVAWFASVFAIDPGVWLALERGEQGAYHVHGLAVTDLQPDEVSKLWAGRVSRARNTSKAQRVTPLVGSREIWSRSKSLRTSLTKTVRYSLKGFDGLALSAAERVVGLAGTDLQRLWYSARLEQARETAAKPAGRFCGVCGASLSGRRADARFCGSTCRSRAHRGR